MKTDQLYLLIDFNKAQMELAFTGENHGMPVAEFCAVIDAVCELGKAMEPKVGKITMANKMKHMVVDNELLKQIDGVFYYCLREPNLSVGKLERIRALKLQLEELLGYDRNLDSRPIQSL